MKKKVFGLVLIALGVLALLQSTEQYNFGLSFWPVVLTLIGGSLLWSGIRKVSWFRLALGLWVGGIGLLDILHAAGATPITGGDIARMGWPILLIAAGIAFMTGRAGVIFTRGIRTKADMRVVGDMRYGGQGPWTLERDLVLEHGVGDVKVDLSTADIAEGLHRVTVRAAVGEVLIRVPDHVTVTVRAGAGIGELIVFGDVRSGLGLSLEKRVTVPEAKSQLEIEAKLGIGSIRVVKTPATAGRFTP